MIDTANPVLDETPESFDAVGVNIAANIDPIGMPYGLMSIGERLAARIPQESHAVVAAQFIGIDHTTGSDVLLDDSSQGEAIHFRHDFRHNLTAALDNGHDREFLFVAAHRTASASLADAAIVGFVYLNRWSLQLQIALREKRANLLEDAPCGFVGDASLALNLLSGDAAPSRPHQVHGVEPSLERSSGLLKDGPSKRINLSAAMVAAICGAALDSVVLALHAALGALSNAARPALLHHVVKAGVVIRKLFVEVPNGIAEWLGNALFDSHNAVSVANTLRVVKGYLPKLFEYFSVNILTLANYSGNMHRVRSCYQRPPPF
jgi:hypothetical protein